MNGDRDEAVHGKIPATHDMGGVSRFFCDTLDTTHHELSDFDREVDALRQILAAKGLMTVDELRRGIEALPEADYLRLSYYQKWLRSIITVLQARGLIEAGDLERHWRGKQA